MNFRRGQNKNDMGRRLFNGFKKSIKRRRREHMRLVDDKNLIPVSRRRQGDRFDDDFTHVIDTRMRRGVHLENVKRRRIRNFPARRAIVTWLWGRTFHTIQGFGQDTGRRRFPATAGAGEEIGVVNAARL
jgi:hypothetical protein